MPQNVLQTGVLDKGLNNRFLKQLRTGDIFNVYKSGISALCFWKLPPKNLMLCLFNSTNKSMTFFKGILFKCTTFSTIHVMFAASEGNSVISYTHIM